MSNKQLWRFGFVILSSGILLGLIIASSFNFTQTSQSSQTSHSRANVILGSQDSLPQKLLQLQNTSDAFVFIAEMVVPTVVTIQSTRLISSADLERFHDGEDLKDFFRFRIPKDFRQQGSGSGIIVSKDGFILTNVHVVEQSEQLRVLLSDNREFKADIVGLDPLTEVAVIKIDADDLPVAKLGNSEQIRVGDWVLAIGNPLELRSTVTAGIISAKERQIDIIHDTYSVESFLQTDAAINPGNSGGALVNLAGEVIGVNTAIATQSGYGAGFGFAIPINLAKKIMSDLIRKGRVERGYLGIAMQNMDEKKAQALAMDRPKGVFIDRVLDDSPAEKAGVKSKDVILRIDNLVISKSNQVQAIIAKKSPGEAVHLDLLRKGSKINIKVVLGRRTDNMVKVSKNNQTRKYDNLGIVVHDLNRELAKELHYTGQVGALVTHVEELSPAADAGIREDDIILEIDDNVVKDRNDFYSILSSLEKNSVSIFAIRRLNEEFHFFVEIPED